MTLWTIVLPLVLGVLFGFALNKAGLTRYTKIVNQFRLIDFTVLKFMMTALVVTSLGVFPLKALGLINFPTIPATYIVGNLIGGLIFGVGMALAGFCPGTAVAGAGEGKWDYIVPGLLGFLTGGVIFGLAYPSFMPKLLKIANFGNVSIPELWHINPILTVFVFALIALALFYAIDRLGLSRKAK